jgi:hypothetical protein
MTAGPGSPGIGLAVYQPGTIQSGGGSGCPPGPTDSCTSAVSTWMAGIWMRTGRGGVGGVMAGSGATLPSPAGEATGDGMRTAWEAVAVAPQATMSRATRGRPAALTESRWPLVRRAIVWCSRRAAERRTCPHRGPGVRARPPTPSERVGVRPGDGSRASRHRLSGRLPSLRPPNR